MLMDMVFSVLVKRYPGDSLLTSTQRTDHARRCIEVFLTGLAEQPAAA